jgi:hypothetical protein
MPSSRYQQLDSLRLTQTITTLKDRIGNRFPESGLYQVSEELLEIAKTASKDAEWIDRPNFLLRLAIAVLIAIVVAGLLITGITLQMPDSRVNLVTFIQALESGINDVVLIGIAIYFLASLERRLKRNRALRSIHRLRVLAHIIDMHQLSKDPDRLFWEKHGLVAPSTKKYSAVQLTRYLDYCSEMLSLTGKVAVLLAQKFEDDVALQAVNDIETLTTGLSQKIWQKVSILHADLNSGRDQNIDADEKSAD